MILFEKSLDELVKKGKVNKADALAFLGKEEEGSAGFGVSTPQMGGGPAKKVG